MAQRKYYKTDAEAMKAKDERNRLEHTSMYKVYRMPKGIRKAGWYAVCTFLEYVNTY